MIARADSATVALWTPDNEAALRQCGQFAAYGADHDFLRFYADDSGNRLSVFENAATLFAVDDAEEMRLFLTMDPTVTSVRTDAKTAQRLAADWGVPLDTEAVMTAPKEAAMFDNVSEIAVRDSYAVLLEGFGDKALPPFDSWYTDVHHRVRHGVCRLVGVYDDGKAAASAMTVAECANAALIGAVATCPSARGKGYASACVLTLAAMLQREGKTVLLSPKNEYAHRLYDRIGFTVVGEWGSVKKR